MTFLISTLQCAFQRRPTLRGSVRRAVSRPSALVTELSSIDAPIVKSEPIEVSDAPAPTKSSVFAPPAAPAAKSSIVEIPSLSDIPLYATARARYVVAYSRFWFLKKQEI
jgi:hypothetical protein